MRYNAALMERLNLKPKMARTIGDFTQKQQFLNTVYEKFFQDFSVKVADTHGIVHTPVSIVSFMVRSVEDIFCKGVWQVALIVRRAHPRVARTSSPRVEIVLHHDPQGDAPGQFHFAPSAR